MRDTVPMERALVSLREGNRRFVSGGLDHPRRGPGRRAEVAVGQHPFAAIVACSDSRVPPEIIFDQGLGDLFVVRTAANVVDDVGLASIEYAAAHLGVPLVVVMGHSRCGAVSAALEGGERAGHLGSVVSALEPAVKRAQGAKGELAWSTARENVRETVASLEASEPVLKGRIERGELRVVGAFYDVESGAVEFLG